MAQNSEVSLTEAATPKAEENEELEANVKKSASADLQDLHRALSSVEPGTLDGDLFTTEDIDWETIDENEETKSPTSSFKQLGKAKAVFINDEAQGSDQSEDSAEAVIETDEPKIDRNVYYELHKMYQIQFQAEKLRNNYLQTQLADYYKGRRMFHVLQKDSSLENQKRYEKQLDEYDEIAEEAARQQSALLGEIETLQNIYQRRKQELGALFQKMQKQEIETGKDLTIAADDQKKKNIEKVLERYLKQQKTELDLLINMRLVYIKLKNKYIETQELIDSLDNLGPNLRIMDYEQLKTDNRNLADKLEEKEMQLTTIRQECQNGMQIMAHTREKINSVDTDIKTYKEELEQVNEEYLDVREQVSSLKFERDKIRRGIQKLQNEVGLLTKPKLLRDMERANKELSDGIIKLEEYKMECANTERQLKKVRNVVTTTREKELKHK